MNKTLLQVQSNFFHSQKNYKSALILHIIDKLKLLVMDLKIDIHNLDHSDHINAINNKGLFYVYDSSECNRKAYDDKVDLMYLNVNQLEKVDRELDKQIILTNKSLIIDMLINQIKQYSDNDLIIDEKTGISFNINDVATSEPIK